MSIHIKRLTTEQVQDITGGMFDVSDVLDAVYDDADGKMNIIVPQKTLIGQFRRETGGTLSDDGDMDLGNNLTLKVTTTDGTDVSTALGNIADGDRIRVELDSDTSVYWHYVVDDESIGSNSARYWWDGYLAPGSAAYGDIADEALVNVYHITAATISDTTYSMSISGNTITLTPSSGDAESITLPTGLSQEDVRDTVAAFIVGDFGISVQDDDFGNTLKIIAGDQTLIGNYEIQTGTIENGDVQFTDSHQTVEVRNLDVNGTNRSSALGNVEVGNILVLERNTNKSHRLYLKVATATANTNSYTFTGALDASSSDTSNFGTVNDSINVYRLVSVDTDTTYTLSFSGGILTLTPSSGTAQEVTIPDTNTQRSDEDIRDVVAAQLRGGASIGLVEDDGADALTIEVYKPVVISEWNVTDLNTVNTGQVGIVTDGSNNQSLRISGTDADGGSWTTAAFPNNGKLVLRKSSDYNVAVIIAYTTVVNAIGVDNTIRLGSPTESSGDFDDFADGDKIEICTYQATPGVVGLSNEEVRDIVAAQLTSGNGIALTEDDAGDTLAVATQGWEWLYGSSTTTNSTTGSTQINITAGTSFDDYRELMFIGVHETNGREFSMVFPIVSFNSNNDDVQPNNGHAYLVVRRTGNSTFQFHHKGNEGCLRAILGKR